MYFSGALPLGDVRLQLSQESRGLMHCEDHSGNLAVTHLVGGLAVVLALTSQVC